MRKELHQLAGFAKSKTLTIWRTPRVLPRRLLHNVQGHACELHHDVVAREPARAYRRDASAPSVVPHNLQTLSGIYLLGTKVTP
jgi:hypothetical protein